MHLLEVGWHEISLSLLLGTPATIAIVSEARSLLRPRSLGLENVEYLVANGLSYVGL